MEQKPSRKLLDQACTELVERVSDALRLKHYSRRTEQACKGWVKHYILFHNKHHSKHTKPQRSIGMVLHANF